MCAEPEEQSNEFLDNLNSYRQSLYASEQAMQSEYDKGIMTLSGGALGISFAFLKDIAGTKGLHDGGLLLTAWVLWGLSISFILSSFFTSTKALRSAAEAVDLKTIYLTLGKSGWAFATKVLNALAGLCFFGGIVFLVWFVSHNLPK